MLIIAAIALERYVNSQIGLPDRREVLLKNLENCFWELRYDDPILTGIIPELADRMGGTLPFTADDRFDQVKLLEQYDFMESLTDFALESENGGLLTLNRRHNERVILQTSAGRYSFSKNTYTLTLPSGIAVNKEDILILHEITNKSVITHGTPLSVKADWGPPNRTKIQDDQLICSYSNGAEVTFVQDKAVSIRLKGVDVAGISMSDANAAAKKAAQKPGS